MSTINTTIPIHPFIHSFTHSLYSWVNGQLSIHSAINQWMHPFIHLIVHFLFNIHSSLSAINQFIQPLSINSTFIHPFFHHPSPIDLVIHQVSLHFFSLHPSPTHSLIDSSIPIPSSFICQQRLTIHLILHLFHSSIGYQFFSINLSIMHLS